jgi:hypothetical protein
MATSPFALPTVGADNPLAPEYLALERQKKIAELLMQKGQQLPEGQMVSGHYVAPSITQQLNPLLNAYMGGNMAEQNEAKTAKLGQLLRGQNVAETKNILDLLQGSSNYQPAVMPQIQRDDMGNVMPAIQSQVGQAPNSQGAMLAGLNATSPVGQMIGQTLLAQKLKPPEQFNLREGEKRFTYNPDTGATTEIAKGNPKEIKYPAQIELALALDRSLPRDPATWTQADADKANLRIEKHIKASAPNMTSINNVMAFEPFANKVQSKMGEGLVENYATLKNIPSQIKSLDRAAQLAPKSFAGSMAEQKLGIAKFFNNNLGTNISGEKVKNTEELRSALFTNVMENLKKLDASPSQQQQQILQQSMGSIGTDPNAIPLVVNTYKQILIDKAKQHNLQVRQAQEGPAKLVYPYDISIPLVEGTGEWRVK